MIFCWGAKDLEGGGGLDMAPAPLHGDTHACIVAQGVAATDVSDFTPTSRQ